MLICTWSRAANQNDQVLGAYLRTIRLLLKITQSPVLTRYSDPLLATVLPNRVGLGVEDSLLEIEGLGRGEQQVEVFHGLGQKVTLHRVSLDARADVGEGGEAGVGLAPLDQAVEKGRAHPAILLVAGVVVKVVGRLDDLGPQVVGAGDDLHSLVVEQFGLDAVERPHLVARVFEAGGAVEVSAQGEHSGEEGVQRAEERGTLLAGVHIDAAVPEPAAGLVGHVGIDRRDRVLPHRPKLGIFEQGRALYKILVVAVDPAPDVAVFDQPPAGLDVDHRPDQADPRAAMIQRDHRPFSGVEIFGVAGEAGEGPVLEDTGADLGRVGEAAAGLVSFEVDKAVGHAGVGVEDSEHAVGEIDCELEEAGVAVELLGRDQAAQDADNRLEVLDLHVVVEVEPRQDQVLGLCRLGGQSHQEQGIERVNGRHEQGGRVPVRVGLGQRLELVVAPSVLFVAVPGVEELGADAVGGDGGGVRGGAVGGGNGRGGHQLCIAFS